MEENKKIIVSKKTFSIEVTEFDNGTIGMERKNDGFSAIELLGICQLVSIDIRDQMAGLIKPDFIKRSVIID